MRWLSVAQVSVVAAVAAATFALVSSPRAEGQARTAGIPRLNGKPDLNGLWQAINSANYDIQAHTAKAAMQMRPGPVVPVPAKEVIALGVSMTKGGDIIELGKALKSATHRIDDALPAGIKLVQLQDQPRAVRTSVNEFVSVLIEAVAIVLAVSFIALGLHKRPSKT